MQAALCGAPLNRCWHQRQLALSLAALLIHCHTCELQGEVSTLRLPTPVQLSCRTQQLKGKKLQQVSTLLNKMRELDKVMTEKASAVLRLAGSGE